MTFFFRENRCPIPLALLGVLVILLFPLGGCATGTLNTELGGTSTAAHYDFQSRLPANDERLFVVLAFSGGGTRAAALSYGVLNALRNEQLVIDNQPTRLLDQVDVISAVSGGSYTAAYYGLFGDRLFEDFEERFLRRNWPRTYGWMLANPYNTARLISPDFNRSDLMAEFLGKQVFDDKTFADLSLGPLPFVIINATDLNNALTFSFIQQQFDFLCSDLSNYPVANAVMASSTVPPAFASMRLRNYPGCETRSKFWVTEALNNRNLLSRKFAVAQGLSRYLDPAQMPYLSLADGGITDNIGVRGSMMSPVAHRGDVQQMAGAFNRRALDSVEKVLVVLVNAQVYSSYPWAASGAEPGTIDTLAASFDAAFNTLTTENISQARREFLAWGESLNLTRSSGKPLVNVYFSTLTFNQVGDPARRAHYNALPTAALTADDVDALIELGGELLRQSEPFQQFLFDMKVLPDAPGDAKTDTPP
ncbi:patatin-like phospholipase family protein [uncultured Marinobacter sp.]|uniref:patatin-like phospholipase family protein n=1 Tax=uncultured Marinobacter sp. TaxID=187379 RepID=UPI0030D79152|tara:strand:+ start:833 stop:2266 length:1434 start_codon:yes stop_codon:yes gene_type:complete